MIAGGDIDVGHFDLTPGAVQKREQRSPGPMLPHLLAIRRTEPLPPENAFWNVWEERKRIATGNQHSGRNSLGLRRKRMHGM